MTQITINTDEVTGASSRFDKERGDLELLLGSTRAMMNNLQAQFKGRRAQKVFGAWQDMQPSLNNAVQALETAGKILKQAAADFSQADGV
jgi:WXG100 family type VII secretion target